MSALYILFCWDEHIYYYQIVSSENGTRGETWLHFRDGGFLRVNISNPGKCWKKIRTLGKLNSPMTLDTLVQGNQAVFCKLIQRHDRAWFECFQFPCDFSGQSQLVLGLWFGAGLDLGLTKIPHHEHTWDRDPLWRQLNPPDKQHRSSSMQSEKRGDIIVFGWFLRFIW